MSEKFSLKDELFNAQKVHQIATEIKSVYQAFEQEAFEKETLEAFATLELKERITHITMMLAKYLPHEYREATAVLLKALPPELDPNKSDDDFGEFIYASYAQFVATFGCKALEVDFSLYALREITKRFSAEFAIRDFINAFPKRTLSFLEECSLSQNYHERRLASEGTRPKLPWAKKVMLSPDEALVILENLYTDSTRYVTRSVANHLNDLSKLEPHLVIETLQRWKHSQRQNEQEMGFIMNHALRSLIKQGNPEALGVLGYSPHPQVQVKDFLLSKREVAIGEVLSFSFELEAEHEEALMVDYVVYFQTKKGQHSSKVYKLKKLILKQGEKRTFSKKHHFKANMTTRTLYAGEHHLALQINGKGYEKQYFHLSQRNS